ncbi:MAG: trypsin-like peptidase domain-containing protein [Clostridia bacterium]|nr:trypsin-like peptidase domain-containing protein [Clostridia bacterium]
MKRLKKIGLLATLILTVIIFSVSSFGCSFVNDSENGDNTQNTSYTVPNLPDSANKSSGVQIASEPRDSAPFSKQDAVAKVRGSSVVVMVSDGVGSGTMVDITNEGVDETNIVYILTNYHVISTKGEVKVYLPNEKYAYGDDEYVFDGNIGGTKASNVNQAVTLVGADKTADVAVLKLNLQGSTLNKSDLCLATIIDTTRYSVVAGEEVFAIGNPTGELPGTVLEGIISYEYRETAIEDIGEMVLHQISVPITHGSSGGGLFNLYGELVGITNAGDDNYSNYNYAVPAKIPTEEGQIENGFVNIAKQLIGTYNNFNGENYGYISGRRELFGFTVSGATTSLTVSSVENGSQAQTQGLKANDTITALSVNGTPIVPLSYSAYTTAMSGIKIGDTITMTVNRTQISIGGKTSTKVVTVSMTARQFYFCDTGIYD